MKRHTGPANWVLDLIVAFVLGLLLGQAFLPLSERLHELAMVAIVLLACGLMWLWAWRNSGTIEREEQEKQATSPVQSFVASDQSTLYEAATPVQAHFRYVMRAARKNEGASATALLEES